MIKNSLLHVVTIGAIAIALTACGAKGIDRKLDYSGTQKELGESYGEAMQGATPDQQNILRDRMMEVLSVGFSLAKNSNPALVEANLAKKNADEFQRVKKMSVRELLTWHLGEQQAQLNKIIPVFEKLQNGEILKIENIEIKELSPKEFTQPPPYFDIKGILSVRNDSDSFDYDFRGCEIYLTIDGKKIDKTGGSGRCEMKFVIIKSKGGKESVNFEYRISGKDEVQNFSEFLKDSEKKKKTTWNFDSSEDSYIRSASDKGEVYSLKSRELQDYKERLVKIAADLTVLK